MNDHQSQRETSGLCLYLGVAQDLLAEAPVVVDCLVITTAGWPYVTVSVKGAGKRVGLTELLTKPEHQARAHVSHVLSMLEERIRND